ncbi:unnamed protein product, partial [Heligmosomoides polygyrus]|uniref:Uncharacterized protein n=1 Tax=Heligmosomoides polygyrus TaxID=6339 RepID=A0A183GCE1_HELPZ
MEPLRGRVMRSDLDMSLDAMKNSIGRRQLVETLVMSACQPASGRNELCRRLSACCAAVGFRVADMSRVKKEMKARDGENKFV